jgi:PleD family two-component response regulator
MAGASDGDCPDTLILRADRGLYRSKQGGRNQVNCQLQESTLAEATVG